ncbi:uncharacterized protein LOC119373356 [Rhipicephalus sanguineus]|uniref:uncharacterized protein LOC119373356 n=1 Tax=Rhipicephalus sanguineus TaxID=34632 RepID=UPI0018939D52|nr:uncharacterized protein LOC119373356 [Rhipicephalus sanguineus]
MALYTHDLEALVAEVEKHPVLYDPGHGKQRDIMKRFQAWRDIGKALNATPSTCKKQWRSVRDRFVREQRLCLLSSRQDTEAQRHAKWGLYKHLGFLARCVKARPNGKRALNHHTGSKKKFGRTGRLRPLRPAVQPVQAVQLVQSSAEDKGVEAADYDTGSECVIFHPEVITQSVLLSMVNVPSPDEIIIPDQPSSMDVQDSTTNCGTTSGHEQISQSAQREPAGSAFDLVTVKEEPLSCVTSEEETGSAGTLLGDGAAAAAPVGDDEASSLPIPRRASPQYRQALLRRKRKSDPTTEPTPKRSHRTGEDDVDADGSDGADTDVVGSTNALLHHLVQATERVRAAADATTTCRLAHVDPGESDTMYLLSLRERLRSFGPRERSLALVRIQEVLHEIEFGTTDR